MVCLTGLGCWVTGFGTKISMQGGVSPSSDFGVNWHLWKGQRESPVGSGVSGRHEATQQEALQAPWGLSGVGGEINSNSPHQSVDAGDLGRRPGLWTVPWGRSPEVVVFVCVYIFYLPNTYNSHKLARPKLWARNSTTWTVTYCVSVGSWVLSRAKMLTQGLKKECGHLRQLCQVPTLGSLFLTHNWEGRCFSSEI